MWESQLEPLSERYRVINIDLRGHGSSGPCNAPFDLDDLVADVLAVLDRLEIDRAVWAGLSIGGMIALRAALAAGQRVAGLILFDTDAGSDTPYKTFKYRLLVVLAGLLGTAPLIPLVVGLFFCRETRNNPALVSTWHERFNEAPLSTIRAGVAALVRRDAIFDRLAAINIPALVMVGAQDRSLPPACSRRLAVALIKADLQLNEKTGHLSNLEQPEVVTSAMLGYLDVNHQGPTTADPGSGSTKELDMKESLKPGIRYQHTFVVSRNKTVPALYPEAEEFVVMPEVFATGFMVGFLEWACIKAINPHLDTPQEQSVGTHVNVSHEAATPVGFEVTATVELTEVDGQRLVFAVEAHDGVDRIARGVHERFVINKEKFDARLEAKRSAASGR